MGNKNNKIKEDISSEICSDIENGFDGQHLFSKESTEFELTTKINKIKEMIYRKYYSKEDALTLAIRNHNLNLVKYLIE